MAERSVVRNRTAMDRARAHWKMGLPKLDLEAPVKLTVVVPRHLRIAARVAGIERDMSLREFVMRAIEKEV